jgi:subtilisin family serine protease
MVREHALITARIRRIGRSLARAAVAIGLLASVVLPSRAGGLALDTEPAAPELLIRLRMALPPEDARALLVSRGLEPLEWLEPIGVWRAVPRADVGATTQSVSANLSDVALWVEANSLAYAQDTIPNDTYYASHQWNLPLIGMPQAWDLSRGGGQVIAIIDSGIDLTHTDLQSKLWHNPCEIAGNLADDDSNGYVDDIVGWDFVQGDAEPADGYGHGTHVSGIAAAATNNALGVAGVGAETRIMVLRTLGNDGRGTYANIALAIHYAADQGARVISLSLGGTDPSILLQEQVAYAQSRGSLVVAAGGNYGTLGLLYPAAIDGVLAVSASTSLDLAWAGNSFGPQLDVAAPGVGIYSTTRGSLYGPMTGTSMATPHVSGLAALIWSYRGDLTWGQVADVITSTAVDIDAQGWDERTGWGRIDAAAALASLTRPARPYRLLLPLFYAAPGTGCLVP